MADKKLSSVSAVSDMNYVYAETASGETVKISKADLATVVAELTENSGWVSLNKGTVYKICSYSYSGGKFLVYDIIIPNWQGASFFKFYIAASYESDTKDLRTGYEGAVGSGVSIYRSDFNFYLVLDGQTGGGRIKLTRSVTISGATIDTSIVESSLPDGAVRIL